MLSWNRMEESKSDGSREECMAISKFHSRIQVFALLPPYPASSPEFPLDPDFPGMVNVFCMLQYLSFNTNLPMSSFNLTQQTKQTQSENDNVRKLIFSRGSVAYLKEELYSPSSAFDWLTSRLRWAACVLNNTMYFRQTRVIIRWNSKEEMIASQNNTRYLNVCFG